MNTSSLIVDRSGPTSGAGIRPGRLPRRVWILAGVWFVVTTALTVIRLLTFNSRGFDLGFFTQAIGGVWLEGLGSVTPMTGWGPFDEHFSPLSLPLAPLAALPLGATSLLIAQNLAVAAAIPAVWQMARRQGASTRWAWLVAVMFSVAPPLLYAVWYDFHASVLAIPFLVLLLDGVWSNSPRRIWLGALGASLAREDMAVIAAVVLLLHFREIPRLHRWSVAAPLLSIGAGMVFVSRRWFIEAGFAYLDSDPSVVVTTAIENVWGMGLVLALVLSLVLPWAFVGTRPNRNFIALIPLVAPLLLSSSIATKLVDFHYYAAVPVFFASAAAVQERQVRKSYCYSLVVLVALIGPFGLSAFGFYPSAPNVVWSGVKDYDNIRAGHELVTCLDRQQLSWTGPDPLVAPAGADAHATVLPLPFFDSNSWNLEPPLLSRSDVTWTPDVVIEPGSRWSRGHDLPQPIADLNVPYELQGVVGDDFLRIWATGMAAIDVEPCLAS